MKGVVLAGGLGIQLYPLTYATNKHLLPVYNQPMVFYPIQTLLRAGIREIIIVVGGPHAADFMSVLRTGKELGIKHLEYAYQESVSWGGRKIEGGIAHALSLCERFADGGPLTIILGDNTTDENISPHVEKFRSGAFVFLKKILDPERFGVVVFDKKNKEKIVAIEEQPEEKKSGYAVTGLYIYDNKVFNYIRSLTPNWEGELSITDLNNLYIKNRALKWAELKGFWTSIRNYDDLYIANKYWAEKAKNKT